MSIMNLIEHNTIEIERGDRTRAKKYVVKLLKSIQFGFIIGCR